MFIPASKLKRRYIAKGRFYRIQYQSHIVIPCRSALEIYARNYEHTSLDPDAFVIMENPGGSESSDNSTGHIDGPLYLSTDVNLTSQINNTALTNAKPDRTQYQIMRLMGIYNWNHVRILNLSDIRTTSSANLLAIHMDLNNDYHSIFSDVRHSGRIQELQGSVGKPVIAAWGTSDGLRHLANMAILNLPYNIKGLRGDKPFKFLHPLPRKYGKPREWLKRFVDEVSF